MCAVALSFQHVGLSVSDLDRAQRFYEDGLGMTEQSRFEVPGPGIRGVILATADGACIELLERPGSTRAATYADPPDAILGQGYGHWALGVEDLEAACAQLVAAGAEVVWNPRDAPQPGARMAYLRDPEGNLIELIRPPREG
jgi:catechol 2,3-dioxygenase-like lactoylglutathione lyase family enzyme